jgi:hypothetical protein
MLVESAAGRPSLTMDHEPRGDESHVDTDLPPRLESDPVGDWTAFLADLLAAELLRELPHEAPAA